jgi:protein TonB
MTLLANLLMLQAAAAPLTAPPPAVETIVLPRDAADPRGPMPLGNPAAWVTTLDYPAAAMRANEQGATGFSLRVDKEGRVSECTIKASSGSASLDEATCSLVTRRARFRPAVDAEGRPKDGEYANRVRWVLPLGTGPEPGMVKIGYSVAESGEVSGCKVTMEGAAASQAGRMTNVCVDGRRMKPYTDRNGQPVARKVTITTTVTVE